MKRSRYLILTAVALSVLALPAGGCKASGMALTERAQLLKININHPGDLPEGAEDNVDVVLSNRGVNDIDHILADVELPPQLVVLDQTPGPGINVTHDPGSNVYHFTIPKIHPTQESHMSFHVRAAFGTAKETGSINVTAWQRDLPRKKLVEQAAIKLR